MILDTSGISLVHELTVCEFVEEVIRPPEDVLASESNNSEPVSDYGSIADDGSAADYGSTADDESIADNESTEDDGSTDDDGSTEDDGSTDDDGSTEDDADVLMEDIFPLELPHPRPELLGKNEDKTQVCWNSFYL